MYKGLHILMIEDNAADVAYASGLLSNHAEVEASESLHDGLDHLHHEAYDLILLDPAVPDSGGFAALMAIHQTNRSVPVVFLGDHGDDHLLLQALRAGASDTINKEDLHFEDNSELGRALLEESIEFCLQRQHRGRELRERLAQLEQQRGKPRHKRPLPAQELAYEYGSLLVRSIDSPGWDKPGQGELPQPSIPEIWTTIATAMARAHATEQQVLLVHCLALRILLLSTAHADFSCYMSGARVLYLELLSELSHRYRQAALAS